MQDLRITINAAVDRPQALETWTLSGFDALHANLQNTPEGGGKTDADLLVPVAEWAELHRAAPNITAMSRLFVGDVDSATEAQTDMLVSSLAGTSAILHTTHSHRTPRKQGLACYRVIVELDREYPPDAHAALWHVVNRRLGGLLDPGARTPEQGYYLPSSPPGFGQFSEVVRLEGKPWCVDQLLSEAAPANTPPLPPTKKQISGPPRHLSANINAWVRSQSDPDRKSAGKAARALLEGKNIITLGKGQRNTLLTRLAGYLAHVYPHHEASEIAEQFRTVGWDLFNADGKYPLEIFAGIVARMQAQECSKLEALALDRATERKAAILRATGGARDHEVTQAETATLTDVFGGQWTQHLLAIYIRSLYFLRPDGTFDPGAVLRESLFVAARDRLAVFGEDVEYSYEDENGKEKQLGDKAFLGRYGTVVRNVIYDMALPRGGWDAKSETILFPAAAPAVDAKRHLDVADWFAKLDPHLVDMLAALPRLGEMAPALVLTGKADCGKTLLAMGVGQVYGANPLDGEAAFDKYNAALLCKMPIIFMDEKAAAAYAKEGTTLIRRFLTQSTRYLDEKFLSKVELRGYPRLIIAANNLDVLNTKEEMSADDREAFAERLVHIDMDPGAQYLDGVRDRIQKEWLDNKHLAEHILWLSENHKIQHPGRRFLVASNHTKLHDGLASRSGFAGDVSYWLLSYLANPGQADGANLPLQYDKDRRSLRVNAAALVEGWGFYLKDHRPPTPSQISRAIKSLSTGVRKKLQNGNRRVDAYEIDPHILRSANEQFRLIEDVDAFFS